MKSQIFYTDTYKDIEIKVQELLNSHEEFLSPSTARSTRAAGDAIEGILGDSFDAILGDLCEEYSARFASITFERCGNNRQTGNSGTGSEFRIVYECLQGIIKYLKPEI